MKKEEIAKVCYEVNKAYCESIGNFSQDTWEDAPKWQKISEVKTQDKLNKILMDALLKHKTQKTIRSLQEAVRKNTKIHFEVELVSKGT